MGSDPATRTKVNYSSRAEHSAGDVWAGICNGARPMPQTTIYDWGHKRGFPPLWHQGSPFLLRLEQLRANEGAAIAFCGRTAQYRCSKVAARQDSGIDMTNKRQAKVAELLRAFSATREQKDWSELPDPVTRLVRADPFALLIAFCFDRGMPWIRAWSIAWEIERKGVLQPERLAAMNEWEVVDLLDSLPVRPRYGTQRGAETVQDAAKLVLDRYRCDTAAIWRDASPAEVERTLMEIRGVGKGIAAMATRILYDDFGCFRGKERQIDVKPDVHLLRVFRRTGLISSLSGHDAIVAARRLNPNFPGALDWGAWRIGQVWCHAQKPGMQHVPSPRPLRPRDLTLADRGSLHYHSGEKRRECSP